MVYRVDRNNFYRTQKQSTVSTPEALSYFLFRIVHALSPPISAYDPQLSLLPSFPGPFVIDPCVGRGSLLKPFADNGYRTLGIDIEYQGFPGTKVQNYLEVAQGELETPDLVIMNPPFNINAQTQEAIKRKYKPRPLLPEIWLQKTIELFGKQIPMILFTPYGFRLNQTHTSTRWRRFLNGDYPEITSIISLPKNVFQNILFHSEILIFNIHGLKAHYFYQG